MKTLLRLFTILALTTTLLNAAAFEKLAKFRTTKIFITSEKPLVVGNNTIEMLLTMKKSVPQDAKVSVKAFMPAMPGMPAMQSKSEAKSLGNGKYTTNINFAMGGTWQIHFIITPKTGKKVRVKSSVNI